MRASALLLATSFLHAAPVLAGEVSGIVVLTSTTASTTPALILRDRHVCGVEAPVYRSWLELQRGKLGGVLLSLDTGPEKSLPTTKVTVDQKNCTYVPRVVAMTARSSVRFTNSDAVLHNVHLFDEGGRTVANWAMPAKGQSTNWIAIKRSGRYRVACDAGHAWMNAHVVVFDHPHFVLSDQRGRFSLKQVPPGRHRLLAWHPDLGEREATVVVPAKGRVEVKVGF